MSARTVTIATSDHGDVTIPEPAWCLGQHEDGEHRIDIAHEGPETTFNVPTARGDIALMTAGIEQRPFVEGAPGTGVFMNVEINGDWYPHDVAGLDRLAARLVDIAGEVRAQARRLTVLQAQEARS